MRWNISDIVSLLKNSLKAILKGEFLLRLNAGRYFIHIVYTFFLFGLVIWTSLMIETTLARVEANRVKLQELQIANVQKTYAVASLGRRTEVAKNLIRLGSDIQEPDKPAYLTDER